MGCYNEKDIHQNIRKKNNNNKNFISRNLTIDEDDNVQNFNYDNKNNYIKPELYNNSNKNTIQNNEIKNSNDYEKSIEMLKKRMIMRK